MNTAKQIAEILLQSNYWIPAQMCKAILHKLCFLHCIASTAKQYRKTSYCNQSYLVDASGTLFWIDPVVKRLLLAEETPFRVNLRRLLQLVVSLPASAPLCWTILAGWSHLSNNSKNQALSQPNTMLKSRSHVLPNKLANKHLVVILQSRLLGTPLGVAFRQLVRRIVPNVLNLLRQLLRLPQQGFNKIFKTEPTTKNVFRCRLCYTMIVKCLCFFFPAIRSTRWLMFLKLWHSHSFQSNALLLQANK